MTAFVSSVKLQADDGRWFLFFAVQILTLSDFFFLFFFFFFGLGVSLLNST